jgi:hypothetical protein
MSSSKLKDGDIVSVVNMAGEYVGRLAGQTESKVTIERPRMVVNGPEGMGFAHGICVTGVQDPQVADFYVGGLVFISPVNAEIEKAWQSQTSGIIL